MNTAVYDAGKMHNRITIRNEHFFALRPCLVHMTYLRFFYICFLFSFSAGFIANFITGGLAKSFGMVMNEFQNIFECPSAYMTLAGGLIYTFMYATCK